MRIDKNWIGRSMDIRQGEGLRVSLMFAYIFLVITTLMIVKPVTNALFLSTFGAGRLPFAFIAVSVFAAAALSLYSKWLHRIDFFRLIIRTLQASIFAMTLMWAGLLTISLRSYTVFILYIWTAITGLIIVSQFWILANTIFNPREARRLFSVVGAGAIAGGIFGGYLTNVLAHWVGSENLILVGAGCLSTCILLAKRLYQNTIDDQHLQRIRQQEQAVKEPHHPLVAIARSRHLSLLAGIIGLSVIVAKLVEYQFSVVATSQIPEADQLAAFFGFWLSTLNLFSLVIQVFVTRRVVGMIGVGVSLFFLPMTIAVGAVLILIQPALWAAIFIKVGDGSLKNSVNKAALELIMLPVPREIKNQAKTFIDVIVDSTATGIGGLLLLAISALYGLSVRPAAILTIVLVGLWCFLITKIRKAYIEAFLFSLTEKNETDEPAAPPLLPNASIVGDIIRVLDGDNVEQILLTLKMIRNFHNKRLVPSLCRLVGHPSAEVRLEALKCGYSYHDQRIQTAVRQLVADNGAESDIAVLTEAMHYLFRHGGKNRQTMLGEFMKSPDMAISGGALICAARESRRNHRLRESLRVHDVIGGLLKQICLEKNPDQTVVQKRICVAAIGAANIPSLFPYLHVFLHDTASDVVKAAVKAAGETRHESFVPMILETIKIPDLKGHCGEALRQFGPEIYPLLANCLANPLVDHEIRCLVPDVLESFDSQAAAAVLLDNLNQTDPCIRHEIIRVLYHMRIHNRDLRFDHQAVVHAILQEARCHIHMLAALYHQTNVSSASDPALHHLRLELARKIEKRLDVNLDRIFRLLGLKYPIGDISRAYNGVVSDQPDLRANAVEFLDNLLEADLKHTLIPIVETALVNPLIEQTILRVGGQVPSQLDAFSQMLPESDADLQLTALSLIERLQSDAYAGLVAELMAVAHPPVRIVAGRLLRKFGYIA